MRGEVREEDGGIRKGSMDFEGSLIFFSLRVFTRGDLRFLGEEILGGSLGTDLAVGIYRAHRG